MLCNIQTRLAYDLHCMQAFTRLGGRFKKTPKAETQISGFFRHMYYNVAETLPHDVKLWETPDEAPADHGKRLLDEILDLACSTPLQEEQRQGPEGLSCRWLPPGKLMDLYLVFMAFCSTRGEKPASVRHFRRIWRSGWDVVLEFRKSSTHALCRICHKLKTSIKYAKTLVEHVSATQQLLKHLEDQFRDRKLYWSLRHRARMCKDILVLIQDSMDKAKLMLPRWVFGRSPKHPIADKIPRPSVTLSAVLCHGFGTYIFLADEHTSKGANYSIEITLQSLNMVWKHCQKNNLPFPSELSCNADNTVAEVKNSVYGRAIAHFVSGRCFRAAGHQHLRVGHSHEDVGDPEQVSICCMYAWRAPCVAVL